MFLYCMNRSIDELVETIDSISDNTKFATKKQDVFYKLIVSVHFLLDAYERIPNKPNWKNELRIVSAFKYINNQLKHDNTLEVFYIEICDGRRFPMKFPMHFGSPTIHWANFLDHSDSNGGFRRSHYEEELMGKDIKNTIKKMQEIILSSYAEVPHDQL